MKLKYLLTILSSLVILMLAVFIYSLKPNEGSDTAHTSGKAKSYDLGDDLVINSGVTDSGSENAIEVNSDDKKTEESLLSHDDELKVQPEAHGGVAKRTAEPAIVSELTFNEALPVLDTDDAAAEQISAVHDDPALDFSKPEDRAKAVARIRAIEEAEKERVAEKARLRGLAMRIHKKGGGSMEIVGFEGNDPIYRETKNLNAAISSGANILWETPYGLDGQGQIVGVWDEGSGLATHREFVQGNRITNLDSASLSSHAMHVMGTVGAQGVSATARGMANAVLIHSRDWGNDNSEMTAAAATANNQLGNRLYLSNHSYGPIGGWSYNNKTSRWTWYGSGADQNAFEDDFGRYGGWQRAMDQLLYNSKYLLPFWAAGNDGNDGPRNGNNVRLSSGSTVDVVYNSSIHPQNDGTYRGGFDNISGDGICKNLVTIGALNDAVDSGARDLSKASLAFFSSVGPTDDGRIKPDLVANGVGLTSTGITSDTSYFSTSGTSMASPSACGSAALVVDQYNRLFNKSMLASTLKSLLIHTADDLGNPGPDYRFGWGHINVRTAVDLIRAYHSQPRLEAISEKSVTTNSSTSVTEFFWDGSSPIKATIAWTDPAGSSTGSHDLRTAKLVNNLDLKLIAPDGTEYYPYVMPFVGRWTVASMNENATMGINNGATNTRDNVEQVNIANPGQNGKWRVEVTYSGALTNNSQDYGLIISGSRSEPDSILVRSPNNGESWVAGVAHNITWAATVQGNVRIDLYQGGNFRSVISVSEPNDGVYTWQIPAGITLGNNFSIRISSLNNPAVQDFSDAFFSIVAKPTLANAVDAEALIWSTGGNTEWFYQSAVTFDTKDAAQSGDINNNESNYIQTNITGPGTLTFKWKVSSEATYDFLIFSVNGIEQTGLLGKISGEVGWTERSIVLGGGVNVVKWSYVKDFSVSTGADAGWVDQVTFTPLASGAYDGWSGGVARTGDKNNDGVSNGLAWALGADSPDSDMTGMMPTAKVEGDEYVFSYRRNDAVLNDASADFYCQHDTDLKSWVRTSGDNSFTINAINDFYGVGVDKVEVRIKFTRVQGTQLFHRVKLDFTNP